jgi:hypothetical protein
MKEKAPDHLYRVQSHSPDFQAGHLQDGTQVLMGFSASGPYIVAVTFDIAGNYLTTLSKEDPMSTDKDSSWEADQERLYQWAVELGFTEDTVEVKKFSLPEHEIQINDFPDHLQELLDSGKELEGDEKEMMDHWVESREFVLIWGRDLWLNENAEVEST